MSWIKNMIQFIYIYIYIYNIEQVFVKTQLIIIIKVFEHNFQTRLFKCCIYMLFQKVTKQFMAQKAAEA